MEPTAGESVTADSSLLHVVGLCLPSTGFTVTHFLVSADVKKSLDFYSRILGGKVVMDGENGQPCIVKLENTWVIINVGGEAKK